MQNQKKMVVGVWGDAVRNYYIARDKGARSEHKGLDRSAEVRTSSEFGGAALFARLLSELSNYPISIEGFTIHGPKRTDESAKERTRSFSYLEHYPLCMDPKGQKWEQVRNLLTKDKFECRWAFRLRGEYREGGDFLEGLEGALGKEQEERKNAWRIREMIGREHYDESRQTLASKLWPSERYECPEGTRVAVIIDHGIGSGGSVRRDRKLWPNWIESNDHAAAPERIIYRLSEPLDIDEKKNPLLRSLLLNFSERLILIVSVEALRSSGVNVSTRISWEKMAQDVNWALRYEFFRGHCKPRHVIVGFDAAGALLYSPLEGMGLRSVSEGALLYVRDMSGQSNEHSRGSSEVDTDSQTTLIYDPSGLERFWMDRHQGAMMGRGYCVTAAITLAVLGLLQEERSTREIEREHLIEAVRIGVRTRRDMQLYGYQKVDSDCQRLLSSNRDIEEGWVVPAVGTIVWPVEYVANRLVSNFINRYNHLNYNAKVHGSIESKKVALEAIGAYDGGIAAAGSVQQNCYESEEGMASGQSVSEKTMEYLAQVGTRDINRTFNARSNVGSGRLNWGVEGLEDGGRSSRLASLDCLCAIDRNLDMAVRIVRDGIPNSNVTVAEIGALRVADRWEIENIRAVRRLIESYAKDSSVSEPVSIAVFGPPGSGKSFAVNQIAQDALARIPGIKHETLTFNVSQFSSLSELGDAFALVRDVVIRGMLPVVFWDEFDSPLESEEYGWLKCFLAPMQDGKFFDEGSMRPIGKCIFVFGGGIFANYEQFCTAATVSSTGETAFDTSVSGKLTMGPGTKARDFLSRLKGFLNVRGLNMQHSNGRRAGERPEWLKAIRPEHYKSKERQFEDATLQGGGKWSAQRNAIEELSSVMIRRAILFRTLCQKYEDWFEDGSGPIKKRKLEIDPHLLHAFLTTEHYRHNARSMTSLIAMSFVEGKRRFDRSFLPSRDQLQIHVMARDFGRAVYYSRFSELFLNSQIYKDKEANLGERASTFKLYIRHFRLLSRLESFDVESDTYIHDPHGTPINIVPEDDLGIFFDDLSKLDGENADAEFKNLFKSFTEFAKRNGMVFCKTSVDERLSLRVSTKKSSR